MQGHTVPGSVTSSGPHKMARDSASVKMVMWNLLMLTQLLSVRARN